MFHSGVNDYPADHYMICYDGCEFEGEVAGVETGYQFYWECPECGTERVWEWSE